MMILRNIFFVFLMLQTVPVFSHPHVFIDTTFTFVFNNSALEGLKVKWILDEMFSASLIMDFDSNKNKIFEEKEIKALERGAFVNLKNYHYFLYITINKKKFPVKQVNNFTAEISNNKIIYYFFVPLNIQVGMADELITAGCFDDSYYCDIIYAKESPVKLENDSDFTCSWEFIDDRKSAYWGGAIIPKIVRLKIRKINE
jgi:ABC-type uncharacterized transport system substrate-binding protein